MAILLALDAGTTSIRCLAVDESAQVIDHSHRELTQSFPQPGWVEHNPQEILRLAIETLSEVARRIVTSGQTIAGLGITNQRETVVAWDRATGLPLAPAIVWQDRRTAERCAELRDLGLGQMIRSTTGLMIDPYFSATKMEWLLGHGVIDATSARNHRQLVDLESHRIVRHRALECRTHHVVRSRFRYLVTRAL